MCACAPSRYTPHQGCTCHRALRTPAWQSLQAVAPPPYAHQSSGVMMEPLYASRDTKSTSPAALPSARCAVSTPLSTCPQALCLFTLAPPPDARGLTHAPYTLVRVRRLPAGYARESEPAGAAGGEEQGRDSGASDQSTAPWSVHGVIRPLMWCWLPGGKRLRGEVDRFVGYRMCGRYPWRPPGHELKAMVPR